MPSLQETVYTATTVYTAPSGFKFTDISKPSVDGCNRYDFSRRKTMTVTKGIPRTAKLFCSCVVGEITGVADQTIALGVEDSKTVTLSAKAQVTGDCKVEGHDGTVNYTYSNRRRYNRCNCRRQCSDSDSSRYSKSKSNSNSGI